jgi:hypothetical protein
MSVDGKKNSRTMKTAVAFVVLSFLVYLSNWRTINAGDTQPASLLPIALVLHGSIDLSMFEQHYRYDPTNWAFFTHIERGYFSRYPLASGVLAVPIYVVPVLLLETIKRPAPDDWIKVAVVMEKISGALITSLSVGVFWLLARALGASRICATTLTSAYAFGSEAWAISSQALWMHGPGVLFILLSILLSLKLAEVPTAKRALIVGLCCGITIAIRVNNVLFVGPLLCWILVKDRRSFFWCMVPVLILGTLVAAYNYAMFGNPTGSYPNGFNEPLLKGLAGLLFSPARGLLIYFPIATFSIAGPFLATRTRSIYVALSAFVLFSFILAGKWVAWYGGWCYGPRLLTETQPILLLFIIPAWGAITSNRLALIAFCFCLGWSVAIQAIGAFRQSNWDFEPKDIDWARERLWNWTDNPVSRAILSPVAKSPWPSAQIVQQFLEDHKQ